MFVLRRLCFCLTLVPCVLALAALRAAEPAIGVEQRCRQQLRRFAAETHLHGIDFVEAQRLLDFPGSIDVLLQMLEQAEPTTQLNAVILLGFAGDSRAFEPLKKFLETAPGQEPLARMAVFARSYVPIAMGCILAQTKDEATRREIFQYLRGGAQPEVWRDRLHWTGPYDGGERMDLGRSTIRALGLSGYPEALVDLEWAKKHVTDHIQKAAEQRTSAKPAVGWQSLRPAERIQLLHLIEEALRTHETVSKSDLKTYYNSHR